MFVLRYLIPICITPFELVEFLVDSCEELYRFKTIVLNKMQKFQIMLLLINLDHVRVPTRPCLSSERTSLIIMLLDMRVETSEASFPYVLSL